VLKYNLNYYVIIEKEERTIFTKRIDKNNKRLFLNRNGEFLKI
jgi:hypothetical protein